MAPAFDIAQGSPEPADQEVAQALFGAGQIVRGIHRAEDVVGRDLLVERGDQTMKTVLANGCVDVEIVQSRHVIRRNPNLMSEWDSLGFNVNPRGPREKPDVGSAHVSVVTGKRRQDTEWRLVAPVQLSPGGAKGRERARKNAWRQKSIEAPRERR